MNRLEVCLLVRRFLDILTPLEPQGRINVLLSPDNVNIHGGGVFLRREVAAPWVKPRPYDGYSAPELYSGKENPATPVYYVGAVMYHMLFGAPPIAAPQRKPGAPLLVGPGPVEQVVDKATELQPENRYANLAAMAVALDEVIRELGGDPDERPEDGETPESGTPAPAELKNPQEATIGPPPEHEADGGAGGPDAPGVPETAGGENPEKKNLI